MDKLHGQLDEPPLDDDYPVYGDYLYIVDGRVFRSHMFGTVRDLKRDLRAQEVRRCDIVGRQAKEQSNG